MQRWLRIPGASPMCCRTSIPTRAMSVIPHRQSARSATTSSTAAAPMTADDLGQCALECAAAQLHAAREVLDGAMSCYALSRPPGHHASQRSGRRLLLLQQQRDCRERAAQKHERVAILDVDVHHGNGTQKHFLRAQGRADRFAACRSRALLPVLLGRCRTSAARTPATGFNHQSAAAAWHGQTTITSCTRYQALASIAEFDPGALVLHLVSMPSSAIPFAGLALTT